MWTKSNGDIDPDIEWLLGHLPKYRTLESRETLSKKICTLLQTRISEGRLPYTLGVFGGWGSGKTTFLALLAKQLMEDPVCRVVYFNSWKYAGFMEIVPSLIYKILQYGVRDTDERRNEAAMKVLLSLGKEYADRFGEWAENRVGVNPVNLFNEVYNVAATADGLKKYVSPEILKEYYGQVDRAQDVLAEILGQVTEKQPAANPIIVLIDELDRCDPDEAYTVIKQMRVLFAMRRVPVAFVVCVNPEPIGLAIKLRYGLESETGDYESRRILEKFVDAYEDLSGLVSLSKFVKNMWKDIPENIRPWILAIDEANGDVNFNLDTLRNASGYDAIVTTIGLYANLRALGKSFDYVCERASSNRHLLWTIWHLEIMVQLDPAFRRVVRLLSQDIRRVVGQTYASLSAFDYSVYSEAGSTHLSYPGDKGKTIFAIFRSLFWENAQAHLEKLKSETVPQSHDRAVLLEELLTDYRRMDFVILLSLLPFDNIEHHQALIQRKNGGRLPNLGAEFSMRLGAQFGYLLANY